MRPRLQPLTIPRISLSLPQLAASISAAIHEPKPTDVAVVTAAASGGDTAAAGASADQLRFLSPFNTRVGLTAGGAGGGDDDSTGGGDGSEDEAAPGHGGGGGDADDDAEVMDRSKLKKMSEKMLRYRSRLAQIPGMIGSPQGGAPGGLLGPGVPAAVVTATGGGGTAGRPGTGAALAGRR